MQNQLLKTGGQRFDTAFGRPRNFLNNRFAYTVISQRARGLSLGINLNPDQRCTFDCVYCEVHRSKRRGGQRVNVRVMSQELRRLLDLVRDDKLRGLAAFRKLPRELLALKEVALSGDGEPTLCPNFAEVVGEVVKVRSRAELPFFKIVLITNTTGLYLPEVRRGLKQFNAKDEIWVKLEAGTQEYMNRVNRPNITLGEVMANILLIGQERPVVIQSLFPLIDGQEPSPEEIEQYLHRLQELKAGGAQIAMVQVYSAHRPPDHPHCGHLPLKSLSRIARQVREVTGLRAEVF